MPRVPLHAISRPRPGWPGYAVALLGIALMTGLIQVAPGASHIANISMLYLLVVIGTAVTFGSGPAVVAAILAFLAFDWFFVNPRHTLTVLDPAEWIALVTFDSTAPRLNLPRFPALGAAPAREGGIGRALIRPPVGREVTAAREREPPLNASSA